MKNNRMDFVEWLHKIRAESHAERKRKRISGPEWLRLVEEEATAIRKRHLLSRKETPVRHRRTPLSATR